MKKIYLVLSHTGTVLSQIIKCYTRDEFSHVSISLDPQMSQLYSFGRLNAYNPFWGGFIHEHIDSGTFKRFKNTRSGVFSLEIEDYKYEKIKKTILEMEKQSKIYKFNYIGLFAVGLHMKIRRKNGFYCAEFVKYLLEKSDVCEKLPAIIRPEDFKYIDNLKLEYIGKLREYNYANLVKDKVSEGVAV